MKRVLLVLCAAVAIASPARAQDPVKVDSKTYKTVAENERVRVLSATVEPNHKGVMHDHPDNFVVFMDDGKVRFKLGDGTITPEQAIKAGDVITATAGKHAPENLGGAINVFVVEVKPGAPKAPAAVPGAVPPPSGAGLTRTPIVSSAHGEAVRLKSDAGFEEPAGTTHEYDAVVVPMGGTGASLTMSGKTVVMKKGEAYLIPRGTAHAVKATAPGESIVVYIKQ